MVDIQEKISVLDETGFDEHMEEICKKIDISPLTLIAILEKEVSPFQMITVILSGRSRGIVQEDELMPLMDLLFDITEKMALFYHKLYSMDMRFREEGADE